MCDTWVALGDATAGGNVLLGKNSDRPIFDCQPLRFHPRQKPSRHGMLELEYVALPQTTVTFATLGSGPYWCWGYEEGINENGVVIGNEAIFTKALRRSIDSYRNGEGPQLGLLGMDLVRLALERSTGTQQAMECIAGLVERHGQFGSGIPGKDHAEGSYDNSFLIADPHEAWILETTGRRWAAKRISSGCAAISNEPSIRTAWEAASSDLEAHAVARGWWAKDMGPHDFARANADERVPRQVSHIRAMRSRQLLAERQGQITPEWMMRLARDHLTDTFLAGPQFDAADPDFHTLCMHVSPAGFTWGNTASSCIAVLPRGADELPVFWWTPGPPCNGCYVPFFVHGSRIPETVSRAGRLGNCIAPPDKVEEDSFAPDSYWWQFRRLLDETKGHPISSRPGYYPARNRAVRARFDAIERAFATELPGVMGRASALRSTSPQEAARLLDGYTQACVERVLRALRELRDSFGDYSVPRE